MQFLLFILAWPTASDARKETQKAEKKVIEDADDLMSQKAKEQNPRAGSSE